MLVGQFYRFFHGCQHDCTAVAGVVVGANKVEGASANKGFKGAFVNLAGIGAEAEIKQVFKRAATVAGGKNILDRAFAQTLNGAEPVNHRRFERHRELKLPGVDVVV